VVVVTSALLAGRLAQNAEALTVIELDKISKLQNRNERKQSRLKNKQQQQALKALQ
jgi:hypothetical protein